MFVTNHPAMIIEKHLVVSDVHLGITKELYDSGVSMPSQVDSLVDRIHELKRKTKATNLILLGDVKHKVPGTNWQEIREIPEFLKKLKFRKIIITKGNHDAQIEKMIPKKKNISVKKTFTVGDYLFTHGHMKVETKKNIVIGHNHPHVMFRDDLGAIYLQPVWVVGKTNGQSVTIVPNFNKLSGAAAINEKGLMGPIAKKLKNPRIFLLDGTDLGNLKDLKMK